MTTKDAIDIIKAATEPQNVGRLNRADYCNVQAAINAIELALTEPEPAKDAGQKSV